MLVPDRNLIQLVACKFSMSTIKIEGKKIPISSFIIMLLTKHRTPQYFLKNMCSAKPRSSHSNSF